MKTLIDLVDYDNGPIIEDLLAQPAEVVNLESAPLNPAAPTDVDAGAITPNAVTIITGTSGNDLLIGDANDNFMFSVGRVMTRCMEAKGPTSSTAAMALIPSAIPMRSAQCGWTRPVHLTL
jgi:hypothetical protein